MRKFKTDQNSNIQAASVRAAACNGTANRDELKRSREKSTSPSQGMEKRKRLSCRDTSLQSDLLYGLQSVADVVEPIYGRFSAPGLPNAGVGRGLKAVEGLAATSPAGCFAVRVLEHAGREVERKTGTGGSTALLLGSMLASRAVASLMLGFPASHIVCGIQKAKIAALTFVRRASWSARSTEQLFQLALVASNYDYALALKVVRPSSDCGRKLLRLASVEHDLSSSALRTSLLREALNLEALAGAAEAASVLAAVRAGINGGLIAGGANVLLHASRELKMVEPANEGEALGIDCMARALSFPMERIIENSGQAAGLIMDDVERVGAISIGYDACQKMLTDLPKRGIVDPTDAAFVAVTQATSVACRLVTLHAMDAAVGYDGPAIGPREPREPTVLSKVWS